MCTPFDTALLLITWRGEIKLILLQNFFKTEIWNVAFLKHISTNPGAFSHRTSPGTGIPRKTFGNTKLDGVCVSCTDGAPQVFYFLLMVRGLALDLLSHHHHLFLMTKVSLFPCVLEDMIWSNNFSPTFLSLKYKVP